MVASWLEMLLFGWPFAFILPILVVLIIVAGQIFWLFWDKIVLKLFRRKK